MVPLLSWLFQFGVIKQESSLLAAALFSVPDTSQPQRRLMLHWNMRGPCCFLLRAKQSFIIAAGTYETAVGILTVPHGCCWLYEKKTLKSEFYLQKEIHWSNPQEVLVLNHGPLTTPLGLSAFCICPLWSTTKMQFLQNPSLEFNLKHNQVQSAAGFLLSVYLLCCHTSLSCCWSYSRMRRRFSVPHQQPLQGACLCLECPSNLPRPGQGKPARSTRKLWDIRWVWRCSSIK